MIWNQPLSRRSRPAGTRRSCVGRMERPAWPWSKSSDCSDDATILQASFSDDPRIGGHQPSLMKTTRVTPDWLLITAALLFLPASTAFPQGSLTPPGAPAPTMKSLDQIEARTPISSAPFTINASGSYYLTKISLSLRGTRSSLPLKVSLSISTVLLSPPRKVRPPERAFS